MVPTKPMTEQTNNPKQAGSRASCMVIFGEFKRFACFAVHTRGNSFAWFVADAEQVDEVTGNPAIIRQALSFEEAISGLQA